MFTLVDSRRDRTCAGTTRREFLRVGSLALGGLTLPGLLAARARAAESGKYVQDRSVVLLFLQGGPSHIELFDPKMSAPVEIRSTTGEVETKLPGVTFGGSFPKLAAMADKLAIVRSYASGNADHTYLSVTSAGNPLKASMSAIYSRVVGANHPVTGMPLNTLVLPESIQADLKLKGNFETGALPTLTAPGDLGPNYAAFSSAGGNQLKKDMELRIARDRFDDRRTLLSALDNAKRRAEADGLAGANKFQEQAFEVIVRGVADAFDLSKEDPRTIEKYDTSKLFRMEELHNYNDLYRSSNLLGKQLLLARRLCEAGCGFVTVSDCGWDMHGNRNTLPKLTAIEPLGLQVDHAVAAFLSDVRERGLSDKILLVVTGEMGRTPRINKNGGRDHYGALSSLLVAGGGLKMGQVVGQSDKNAERPATEPYSPQHLLGTVMHTLFDVSQLRLARSVPADVAKVITDSEPIKELI